MTRNLLASIPQKTGQLSTTHHRTGYPYGSVCNFAGLDDGPLAATNVSIVLLLRILNAFRDVATKAA